MLKPAIIEQMINKGLDLSKPYTQEELNSLLNENNNVEENRNEIVDVEISVSVNNSENENINETDIVEGADVSTKQEETAPEQNIEKPAKVTKSRAKKAS